MLNDYIPIIDTASTHLVKRKPRPGCQSCKRFKSSSSTDSSDSHFQSIALNDHLELIPQGSILVY
jgi:5-methylcytosine-specific restriction endonuclease McrA